ncbi:ribosome small subunit-dependent GTPase A [Virgibacillus sp. MG-45]|uniref:ribosome small subunit-dependent GTPase A n=1 Tax=Virgibacillus sp. MG-45 TaxID=3102791 RepID=UPI003FCCE590
MLGWDQAISVQDESQFARVITVQKNSYQVSDGETEYIAHVSGRFLNEATDTLDFPAVGDWVKVQKLKMEKKAVITGLLARKSAFIRQAAGFKTEAQVVAANMDYVLIVHSLNHDLNVRRMERYILSTYESGASPIIVLTKADQCSLDDVEQAIEKIEEVAIGIPIVPISSITGQGLEQLVPYIEKGKTIVLLGSSGVGKSTLINVWMERDVQVTQTIREDDSKGRHTTTHRELFLLPNGAMVIDTPGMRELQLWDGDTALDTTFQDIEAFAEACKFRDCQHETEPGCRVQEAIAVGELSEGRYQSYLKLQRELAFEQRRQDQKAKLLEKSKWKQITKQQKSHYKQTKKK